MGASCVLYKNQNPLCPISHWREGWVNSTASSPALAQHKILDPVRNQPAILATGSHLTELS